MNILVTGANGQLGNEMRRVAAESSDNYTFTDVAELDITDIDAVCAKVKETEADVIVNCAAYTNVDKAEDDVARADLINNQAAGNLAYAAKEARATLIHVSTDYVFDGSSSIPYIETDDTCPTGVYGKTKLAGEMAVIATGCRSIIIRTAWLYSRWGNNFVKTMRRLTAERDSINVVFDQVGSPTFAGDLADAISHIIENRLTDRTGVYHFTDEEYAHGTTSLLPSQRRRATAATSIQSTPTSIRARWNVRTIPCSTNRNSATHSALPFLIGTHL